MLFCVFTLSLQINHMFPLQDVEHLLIKRLSEPKFFRLEYGDLKGFDAMVQSTKMPKHAILSYESNRLHFFLHDEERICRCVWDGIVRYDEKKDIMKHMLSWWIQRHSQLDQRLVSYEDGVIFAEVAKEMREEIVETNVERINRTDVLEHDDLIDRT